MKVPIAFVIQKKKILRVLLESEDVNIGLFYVRDGYFERIESLEKSVENKVVFCEIQMVIRGSRESGIF